MNLKHIESRPSKANRDCYEFYVEVHDDKLEEKNLQLAIEELKKRCRSVVLHREEAGKFLCFCFVVRQVVDYDVNLHLVKEIGCE